MNVTNTVELMSAAAEALGNRDLESLYGLLELVDGWMQSDESAEAQKAMLNAMVGALEA